jgi:hypothetical protein
VQGHTVLYENAFVDLSIQTSEGDVLFELKTAPTARTCIREALGQLLDYAHYAERGRPINPDPANRS